MTEKDIISIVLAYLLGGVCTGYYLVRLRSGIDIRRTGSGGVGARNVGRVLGRSGFVITLFGDAAKGVVAVLLARKFQVDARLVSLVLVAVIAGHVWPLFLRFHGGRGVATALGALLAFDYWLLLLLLGMTVILMVFRRGFIISGLCAFLFLPVVAYILHFPGHSVVALTGSSAIILFAHRVHIRKALSGEISPKEA